MRETNKQDILGSLLCAAKEPKMDVRMIAVNCLGFYTNQAERVVPVLTKALADDYPDVRVRAVMAFYKINPAAAEKAGALSVLFDSRSY